MDQSRNFGKICRKREETRPNQSRIKEEIDDLQVPPQKIEEADVVSSEKDFGQLQSKHCLLIEQGNLKKRKSCETDNINQNDETRQITFPVKAHLPLIIDDLVIWPLESLLRMIRAPLLRALHQKMSRHPQALPLHCSFPLDSELHSLYFGETQKELGDDEIKQLLGPAMKKTYDRGSYALINPPMIISRMKSPRQTEKKKLGSLFIIQFLIKRESFNGQNTISEEFVSSNLHEMGVGTCFLVQARCDVLVKGTE